MKLNLKQLIGSPGIRIVLLLVIYTAVLSLSRWLAYQLRFDFAVPPQFEVQLAAHGWWVVALKLFLLLCFSQFAGLLSYFSIPDLRRLLYATASSSVILLGLRYYTDLFFTPPRGVLLIDFLLSFGGLTAVRLGFRLVRERFLAPQSRSRRRARRVGIIGAGDVGASLARELTVKRGLGLHPVAFFDDDRNKWHSRIHDIPVIGPPEALLNQKLNLELEEAIIAMPSAPARRIGEVVKILQQARLKFETVPSMDQLATGKVKVSQLRSVEIQDLLGREPVKLETENIRQILSARVIMVTGA
ncbi:MAG: capsule biosynthesis protein CapD, partial [Verrucomicrobia bacterium]